MKVTEKIAVLRNLMQQDGIDYYYIPTNDFHGSEYVADYFKCREYMSGFTRSEERRVGKECRSRWSPYH